MSNTTRRYITHDTETFSVRVTPEVKKTLEELARKERRSLNATVGLILEQFIENGQKTA